MRFYKAMEHLRQKFSSGNTVPVTTATITREEFEAIENFLRQAEFQTPRESFDDDETNVGC